MKTQDTHCLKRKCLSMEDNMDMDNDSTRHCPCCRLALRTVMSILKEEHENDLKKLREEKETELVNVVNVKNRISELETSLEEMRVKIGMVMEVRDNKIKNLQRAILNIRTDVKNGKPPREPSPIETKEEYQSHYKFSSN